MLTKVQRFISVRNEIKHFLGHKHGKMLLKIWHTL